MSKFSVRSVNDLRLAALAQKELGLYTPTERELTPLLFVVVQDRFAFGVTDQAEDLGVVLDLNKYRESTKNGPGKMHRTYTVLTLRGGQKECSRESLVVATAAEIRSYEGLTPENDFLAAVNWALKYGKSDANYGRAKAAAQDCTEDVIFITPAECGGCVNDLCKTLTAIPLPIDASILKP